MLPNNENIMENSVDEVATPLNLTPPVPKDSTNEQSSQSAWKIAANNDDSDDLSTSPTYPFKRGKDDPSFSSICGEEGGVEKEGDGDEDEDREEDEERDIENSEEGYESDGDANSDEDLTSSDSFPIPFSISSMLATSNGAVYHPPPKLLSSFDLEGVANLIKDGQAKNIIFMCGAGISVSSGIPDFRSPGTGLYSQLEKYGLPFPEAIFDISYFRHVSPRPFFTLAKELFPGSYRPSPAHCFLNLVHQKGLLLRVFTQNIDSLEGLAGLPLDKVVAAHGNFDASHCIECGKLFDIEYVRHAVFGTRRKKRVRKRDAGEGGEGVRGEGVKGEGEEDIEEEEEEEETKEEDVKDKIINETEENKEEEEEKGEKGNAKEELKK
uniref:Deacetylase sirtuin-type domain-containing protein n=1 Tax=Polytomella parva TaxID=51329 RepID=A0A7S0YCI0_9CHLO|mmetsp:Transcript_17227/g.31426  ORF Transcript_17227/g.31426 Transcript_17227/m.31426 type:complete len:381 (+) Transcript_17227:318-1460(+)